MSLNRDDYRVLCGTWRIREVPSGDPRLGDKWGLTSWADFTVYIDSSATWEMKVEILIHETTHIIAGGRDKLDLTIEDDVRTYSEVLTDTLLRNGILKGGFDGGT